MDPGRLRRDPRPPGAREGSRAGPGTRLLRAAEGEARARGRGQVVPSAHDFRAPEFYRRFGDEVSAAVDGDPRGHRQFFLRKASG